ncbi:hypothetical protein L292_1704 [Acinetobacter junii CIP 107470 = MTCC 11364]|uniref:BcepMu gp16 family phage-associated protein n=1 Tax=Acinetobacter junii CIP 107470 = MTCC 11364 TaxID=1217666 RepID=S7XWM8_ACIJU|nr:hypothetical protein [Acinetobacter junii]EPR80258.1 hypothetical protein L292_1704 [Acinetobacter junii CIP 107470 = MTCC 11364]
MNTPEQIRNNFFKDGYSISQWAKDNNFPVDLVYKGLCCTNRRKVELF